VARLLRCALCGYKAVQSIGKKHVLCDNGGCAQGVEGQWPPVWNRIQRAISAKLKAARGKVIRRAIMVPHKTSGKPYCICLGRIAKRSRCAGSSCQDVLIIADPAARKSGGK